MADFMQAVKWMKEGKKVIRKGMKINNELVILTAKKFSDRISISYIDENGTGTEWAYTFKIDDYEATDWEIYEEDIRTLADKVFDRNGQRVYKERDVKTFIQKVKDDISVWTKKHGHESVIREYVIKTLDKRAGDL